MAGFPWRAIEDLKAFLEDACPETSSVEDALALTKACAELERLAEGGRILFCARAPESSAWLDSGAKSPAKWLAEQTRCETKDAARAFETSKALGHLPGTDATLRLGTVDPLLLHVVARAASKDPGSEEELIELAKAEHPDTLRSRAREVLAQAASAEEEQARYRRLHERRYCRSYSDVEGALRLEARLAPEQGARLVSALQKEADAVFEAARDNGLYESPGAYMADALVNLVTEKPCPRAEGRSRAENTDRTRDRTRSRDRTRPGDTLVIRVDAEALQRGHVGAGEICEIPGVGPVPVASARRLLGEGFVKILVRRGVDVTTVCHVGRAVPAHLQSALDERDRRCVVPGCAVSRGLENHHFAEDFALCGTSSLANLARVCKRHHDLITYSGYRLEGGPGAWRFLGVSEGAEPELKDTG